MYPLVQLSDTAGQIYSWHWFIDLSAGIYLVCHLK